MDPWTDKKHRIIFEFLVFSVNWVHILTWGEMDAMWWLAESDIILKQKDRIQQIAVHMNYEITAKDK